MPSTILKTFKCNHSPSLKYKQWAQRLYGDNKCIVSPVEKGKSGHDHVHFIGYTDLSKRQYNKIKDELYEAHPWHEETNEEGKLRYPNCCPIRAANKIVNDKGFQYVMKTFTDKTPLEYSQGFSEEELLALKAASDEHVEKMKNGMKEHIHGIQYHGAPADILIKLAHDCGIYLRVEKVNSRPQFVTDVYNIMMSHPQATDEWATFIVDRRLGLK